VKFSLTGQDRALDILKGLLRTKRIPPALLFYGPDGTGKFRAATEFARILNCTGIPHAEKKSPAPKPQPGPDEGLLLFAAQPEKAETEKLPPPPAPKKIKLPPDEYCGACDSCLQISKGAHPDIRVIDTAFQSALLEEDRESENIKIDTVRELIRWADRKPMLSEYKVFIIRDAHKLTDEAQNALLKTLEAPAPGTIIILTASKKNAMLSTVLSRCCPVEFSPLTKTSVKNILVANGAEPSAASRAASLANGSVQQAKDIEIFLERLQKCDSGDGTRIFKFAAQLPRDSHKARAEVKTMLDIVLEKQRAEWSRCGNGEEKKYSELISKTLELRRMLNSNVSYARVLQSALLESEAAGLTVEKIFGE